MVTSLKARELMYTALLQQIIDKHYRAGDAIPPEIVRLFADIDLAFRDREPGRARDREDQDLNQETDFIKQDVDPTPTHIRAKDEDDAVIVERDVRMLNQKLLDANTLLTSERDRQNEHVRMLEDLTQMKSDFVSSVSHELRTPLASILGFIETILIDPEMLWETEREFLGIIFNESQRLAKLINDLLDLSRIESRHVEIEKTETNIVPIISHAISLVITEAENKSITLTSTCEHPALIARFDKERMTQIIINLLSNAVKFTQDGGAVAISSGIIDGCLEVTVKDNGMGIPASDIQFIFTKFFRVYRPRLQIRGTGLGLAIVKHLVELHGGTIHAESEEAKGSIFTVRIPI